MKSTIIITMFLAAIVSGWAQHADNNSHSQKHLQLPLYATWHFAQSSSGSFGLFASAGIVLNLNLDNDPINYSPKVAEVDPTTMSVHYGYCNFQLHSDCTLTYGPYLALGYESRMDSGHRLVATLSLMANQSRYTYELGIGPSPVENRLFPLAQNELELGLTYYF